MNYEELLKRGPYELGAVEKKKIYADMLSELTDSHRNRCRPVLQCAGRCVGKPTERRRNSHGPGLHV